MLAVAAGVSIGTVSNTLNHPERVTAETRERVMAAVQELGFVPNQQARVLTGAPSRTIGLMVVDLISPFFMEVAHAVEQAASEAGYVVILCNSENLAERQDQRLKLLAAQRVVGALLTFVLIIAVLMLIISAIMWAIASAHGNYSTASKGRVGVLVSVGAAALAGAGVAWMNWLIALGDQL